MNDTDTKKFLTGTAYDVLKAIVTMWLPGFATFYLTLGDLWGLPEPAKVAATITALTTFLGLGLKLSSMRYYDSTAPYDGKVNVIEKPDGGLLYELEVDANVSDIPNFRNLNLKVGDKIPQNLDIDFTPDWD